MLRERCRLATIVSTSLLALAFGGVAGPAIALAAPCPVLDSDFNHDENADVAVGEPFAKIGGDNAAGAVRILYGTDTGLSIAGTDRFTQDTAGLGTAGGSTERFGFALASGNFNGDCYADLAILSPGDGIHGLVVLFGSDTGLETAGVQLFAVQGIAVESGDFNGDGADDLVVGGNNTVHGLSGGGSGLTFLGSFDQDSTGVPGVDEAGDAFGEALATADFNGDDKDDLAIGAWGEDLGSSASKRDAGSVTILFGADFFLTTTSAKLLTQDSPGMPGSAEGDHFGEALAAGEFNNDVWADLAVGSPEETLGSDTRTGTVHVIDGTATGPDTARSKTLHQDTPGMPGANEDGDHFGDALTVGEFNGDGYNDLVIGVKNENVGSVVDAGSVTIVFSNGPDGGLITAGAQGLSQDTTGVLGTAERADFFGASLYAATVTGNGRSDLLVGVWGEDTGSLVADGMIHFMASSATGIVTAGNQTWTETNIDGSGQSFAGFGHSID